MEEALEIRVCAREQLHAALELVLESLPPDQRGPLVDSLGRARGEPLAPFDALVVATEGPRLLAAAWGQPQPGKTASLWTPRARRRRLTSDVAIAMVERVVALADDAGVAVTQTLLEQEDDATLTPLLRSGFRRMAELWYLEWTPSTGLIGDALADAEFPAYDPGAPGRLERLVERTYADTLDCPELEGMREVRDVLHGYRGTGEHDPELWRVIRHGGEDVGVLMLAEYPESRQLELVYVGVAPEARGRGLGARAVREVQKVARERGAQRVVLAVDSRNKPAVDIYRAAGFRRWAHRYAYLRRAGGGWR